jgi:hypothetical protein
VVVAERHPYLLRGGRHVLSSVSSFAPSARFTPKYR